MTGRIAITGATGFVGRALLPVLIAEQRQLVALLRAPSPDLDPRIEQRIIGPIEALDVAGWRAALADCQKLVHLAGIAHIGPGVADSAYQAVNCRATLAMADAAVACGTYRVVFLSSIRAQSGPTSGTILTESTPPDPTDAYGRSKLAAEQGLRERSLDTVILRPTLILGDAPKGNLALVARLAASGLPLPLAGIAARRSLVALADVVGAIRSGLQPDGLSAGTYVLAHPDALTIGDIIAALRAGMGMPPRLFTLPQVLLSAVPRLLGRGDIWDRVAAPLVASSDRLTAAGFTFRQPPVESLRALGRTLRAQ